jgi:hypothetical protein
MPERLQAFLSKSLVADSSSNWANHQATGSRALQAISDEGVFLTQDIGTTRGEIDYVASNRGIDPRGVRSAEWIRYLPTVDGQIGCFQTDQCPESDFR